MTERHIQRREVLRGFAGCAAGIMAVELAPKEARGQGKGVYLPDSGLVTRKPKPLPYEEIPGFLSKGQIAPHHTAHYGGALRGFVSADERLSALLRSRQPLATVEHSGLLKSWVGKANSVALHELYFYNMGAKGGNPREDVRAALAKRFGSLERWAEDFKAACGAGRGWGLLARDAVNGQLYNVASDLHQDGVLWFGQPVIVCDVYEHAFYVDYKNKKADYVGKFVEHIDWKEVNRRFRQLG